MENVNTISANYGKCLHSAICTTEENSGFIYRKAYVGDWGDWDEQPDNNSVTDPNCYDVEELI